MTAKRTLASVSGPVARALAAARERLAGLSPGGTSAGGTAAGGSGTGNEPKSPDPRNATTESEGIAGAARAIAPVVWLIGKVQAGKTSIIAALTGDPTAVIGTGYKPCTRTARVYDFPAEAPLIRFLDTRGIGEAAYDPAEDLAAAEAEARLVIAVMKVADPAQQAVLAILNDVRSRHPDWPILVAQTGLHEVYPDGIATHPEPYPFAGAFEPGRLVGAGVPADLVRALAYQRSLLEGLPGTGRTVFVPIDFTLPGDGFSPRLYGLDALRKGLGQLAPEAVTTAIETASQGGGDKRQSQAATLSLGYASAAAAAELVPIAGAVAVPAVQARLLTRIAERSGAVLDRRTATEFAAALGTGLVARYAAGYGVRQLVKLVPVYGQTVGAAAAAATSFATTYALGRAASYFLERRAAGSTSRGDVREVYARALAEAFAIARRRRIGEEGGAAS